MDLKKELKDIIKYGQGSKENKKKAINLAVCIIDALNSYKKIDDNDLEKYITGSSAYPFHIC